MASTREDEAARQKAVQAVDVNAGSGYDGSDLNGTTIDTQPSAGQKFKCLKLILDAGGGSNNDVVSLDLYESSDDSSWSKVTDVTITDLEAGSSGTADYETVDVDISALERYLRLEAVSSDQTVSSTIEVAAYAVLSGAKETPCSDAADG